MDKDSRIYIAGHNGLVGSALRRRLTQLGYKNLICPIRSWVDLTRAEDVSDLFQIHRPDYVFLAAAKVGGILANKKYPADFITANLAIQQNIIPACHQFGVKKLLFLSSVCAYPKKIVRPLIEDDLWQGPVEQTSQSYATAKLAGIQMCQAYRSQFGCNFIIAIPCNLYGPHDNFKPSEAHVIPGLIRAFHDAKSRDLSERRCWGTGQVSRDFLYSDDCADALIFLMNNYDDASPINIGGHEIFIKNLAEKIAKLVGFKKIISWDTTMEDGNIRRVLDVTKMEKLGWNPSMSLDQGLELTYDWFLKNV